MSPDLFSNFGVNRAEGGPFVPPTRADQPAGGIVANGLASIRGLAKTLPLSTPLEHYQIGSRFGPRLDPFSGSAAFHTGLDFDAAYMSPVYATAPVIVTYAGYRGACGKVVEIDHGNGIATSTGTCIVTPSRWAKGRGSYVGSVFSGALGTPRVHTCTTR